jgi:hypothetical protein
VHQTIKPHPCPTDKRRAEVVDVKVVPEQHLRWLEELGFIK